MEDGSEERNKKSKSRSRSRKRTYYKNPFLNFLRDFRQMPDHQSASSRDLFKLAGERWRSLSDSDREPYISQAQLAKEKPGHYKVKQRGKRKGHRKCSKCGHRHGSPITEDSGGEATQDDDPTSLSSRSDSKSGSLTTGDDFTDDSTFHF